MFLLVGLGPHPPKTIQLGALEALKTADVVYLETYTNLGYSVADLAAFLGKPVLAAPRTIVESDAVLRDAKTNTVALCVIGDIFTATTHSTIVLECRARSIPYQLFPNAGVMNTIALTGLELYQFGQTVSIPYPIGDYQPDSYLAKILANQVIGLHTLCLLDIKADEGRFMTIPEALTLLVDKGGLTVPLALGVARLGAPDMRIAAGSAAELATVEWGPQPHCLVIPGKRNAVEDEYIVLWRAAAKPSGPNP